MAMAVNAPTSLRMTTQREEDMQDKEERTDYSLYVPLMRHSSSQCVENPDIVGML